MVRTSSGIRSVDVANCRGTVCIVAPDFLFAFAFIFTFISPPPRLSSDPQTVDALEKYLDRSGFARRSLTPCALGGPARSQHRCVRSRQRSPRGQRHSVPALPPEAIPPPATAAEPPRSRPSHPARQGSTRRQLRRRWCDIARRWAARRRPARGYAKGDLR